MQQYKCQFYTSISIQPSSVFLSFQTILSGQGGVNGWEAWSISSSEPKPKNIKK